MDRTHDVVEREQREVDRARRKRDVEERVGDAEAEPRGPAIADSIQCLPLRVAPRKARLGLHFALHERVIAVLGVEHHRERVGADVGGVWVARGVAECVVLAVQDRVAARHEKRRALDDPGREVEDALPAAAHRELPMRAVAVQEERLQEHREQPMADEEQRNREHLA